MSSVNRSNYFIDPRYPNQLRLRHTDGAFANVSRLVLGKRIYEGIQVVWNEFIVDIDQLTPTELEGRLTLMVGGEREDRQRSKEYDVSELFEKMLLLPKRQLSSDIASLKESLYLDPLQKMKQKFIESYKDEVNKYTAVYNRFITLTRSLPPPVLRLKAADLSALYTEEDSKLASREHKLSIDWVSPSGLEDTLSIPIHGCAIAVNGGNLKTAFIMDMKEKEENTIKISGANPAILKKLVQYLYGLPIDLTDPSEAIVLNEIATLWELEPLKEICLPLFMPEYLLKADPTHLPTQQEFSATLGNSEVEVLRASQKASEQIQILWERYLQPHIQRMSLSP